MEIYGICKQQNNKTTTTSKNILEYCCISFHINFRSRTKTLIQIHKPTYTHTGKRTHTQINATYIYSIHYVPKHAPVGNTRKRTHLHFGSNINMHLRTRVIWDGMVSVTICADYEMLDSAHFVTLHASVAHFATVHVASLPAHNSCGLRL